MFTCKKAPLAAAAALVVVGLAGCFGGGGSDASTPVTPTPPAKVPAAGAMVDGYVSGATVYCDVNGNGKADAGEAQTTTLADGSYKFDDCNSPVVGSGGTDTATGFAFSGVLKTPAGSGFMTPLTTLVTGTGLSTADLAKLLGLPAGTDPTKVDPTKDVNLYKTTLAVQQIIAQLAKAIAGSNLDLNSIYSQVAGALVETLKAAAASGTVLITADGLNASVLSTLTDKVQSIATAAGATGVDIAGAVNSIKAEAQAFLNATDLDSLKNIAKEQQNPEKPVAGASFLTLTADSIDFIQTPLTSVKTVSVATLASTGVEVTSLNKFALAVGVTGKPTVGTSAVALNMVEVQSAGSAGRALTAMIDKVVFSLGANNQLSLSVPADATVHVYGRKGTNSEVSGSFKMGDSQGTKVVRVENNKLTIDYSGLVTRVLGSNSITNKAGLDYWEGIQGTFTVTAAISNLDLRTTDKKALASTKVDVKNVSGGLLGSVSGVGFTGNVTIKAAQ